MHAQNICSKAAARVDYRWTTIPLALESWMHLGPRLHLFPRDPGKDAVQGPQKLSEELERSKEFLGQFLRSEDCIFSRDPKEKVESYHYTLVMLVYH